MKVHIKQIETIACFDLEGVPMPVRFRVDGEVYKVHQVSNISEEKLAGNRMKIYRCQSEIDGQLKPFKLKFEIQTCKWFQFKMYRR